MYACAYEAATRRHWRSAEQLKSNRSFDEAGYHYGFVAECAVKHALDKRFLTGQAPFVHFEDGATDDLRAQALRRLQGRRAAKLINLLRDHQFLKNWHISMRYAVDGTVDDVQCVAWRRNAQSVMAATEIKP